MGLADRQGVAGGELHPEAVQMPVELPRGPGTVGADQDLLPGQSLGLSKEALGQLGSRGVEDPDVVFGAVRSGVAGPQHGGANFPGSIAAP